MRFGSGFFAATGSLRGVALKLALGLAFAGFVFLMYEHGWFGATLVEPSDRPGTDAAVMFVSAYVLECAFGVDYLLVMSALFASFRIRRHEQPRILGWSLAAAIIVRTVSLVGAGFAAQVFLAAFLVFGAYIVHVGIQELKRRDEDDSGSAMHGAITLLLRYLFGPGFVGTVAVVDLHFAFDSIALLAISRTLFIVISANILATLALRSCFFVLVERDFDFARARTATAVLFIVSGVTIIARHHYELYVPPALALAVIVAVVAAVLVASSKAPPGHAIQ